MNFIKIWLVVFAIMMIFSTFLFQDTTVASTELRTQARDVAQADGITLEKETIDGGIAFLGEAFSYTISIKNENSVAQPAELFDEVPEAIILRDYTVTATVGVADVSEQRISWVGEIPANDAVRISYFAIPPSLSSPGEIVTNTAILSFGDETLDSSVIVTTQHGDYFFLWSFFRPIVNLIAYTLIQIDFVLEGVEIPYTFGFSIILFTIAVRALTFPLNLQQIKSAKAMQALQPQMKALQDKHKDDKETLAMEQMKLYREHGVNPLGGCLPMLVQMPIWISLYWALIQLSNEGLLTDGFFWIPSLAGPVSYEQASIEWLWSSDMLTVISYLILPVLLVVSQMYMQQMLTPPTTDPQQQQIQQMMKFMPLMFGYFALIVPAGLTLYWFTSNALMLAQQYFMKSQIGPPALATAGATADAGTSSSSEVNLTKTDSSPPVKNKSDNKPAESKPTNQNNRGKNAKKRKSRNKRKNRR